MRALITGVCGQDGALLAKHLLDKEYKVMGLERRSSSRDYWRLKELGLCDEIGNPVNPSFIMTSGDLTDQNSIDRVVAQFMPHEIYNLGAQSFVGSSWSLAESTMDVNALGFLRILEAARKFCPDARIYQASSSEQFGAANREVVLNEESTFIPRSPYAVSKCAAQQLAEVYKESYNMFVSCGILFNHESEYRGMEFVTRKIVYNLCKVKLGLQDCVRLGNLSAKRDWGYAGDYVKAMHLVLQHKEPDNFVVATGRTRSVQDFAYKVTEELGLYTNAIQIDPKLMRPADVGCLIGDASKAKNVLGWEPETSFDKMVDKMIVRDMARIKRDLN